MKGDFTRITFDPKKHFSRVLMQQGRVQLDADWNEQAAILLHYLETLAADLIGPYGGPDSGCGFALVSPNQGRLQPHKLLRKPVLQLGIDFPIYDGHYYVDGLLCENDRDITYNSQDDYPLPKELKTGTTYLVYLDVWERHITALEESAIREVALGLGGPDTATRAKVVWQVKVIDKLPKGEAIPLNPEKDLVFKNWRSWVENWNAQADCKLKVRLPPAQSNTDLCTIAPDSMYRGKENQLYRVEIHAGGKLPDVKPRDEKLGDEKPPTFKWSRDNGSIAAAWLGNSEDDGMIVSNARGFAAGHWIEITSDTDDLLGKPGQMVKIVKVEGDVLYPESRQNWDKDPAKKVRRWDQVETEDIKLPDGSESIKEGTGETGWIDLENGIQVQFQPNGAYRTGDYWLIPARTVGTIEWPGDPKDPDAVAPHGITHHYAPLWIIQVESDGTVKPLEKNDLRCKFAAVVKLTDESTINMPNPPAEKK